ISRNSPSLSIGKTGRMQIHHASSRARPEKSVVVVPNVGSAVSDLLTAGHRERRRNQIAVRVQVHGAGGCARPEKGVKVTVGGNRSVSDLLSSRQTKAEGLIICGGMQIHS